MQPAPPSAFGGKSNGAGVKIIKKTYEKPVLLTRRQKLSSVVAIAILSNIKS